MSADLAFLQHGREWAGEDLTGWLITEKLDGCRAYWTGTALVSRTGQRIAVPYHVMHGLPADCPLDGELWAGRGTFEELRRGVQYGQWQGTLGHAVRFMVFDEPGSALPGQRRFLAELALQSARRVGGSALLLDGFIASSTEHALGSLRSVIAKGGEGLMAQHPTAPYQAGRTSSLLKLKAAALEDWRAGAPAAHA